MGRFNNMDGFVSGNEFDDDHDLGMSAPGNSQKIIVNLEDAVLEEQKLFQILEVSSLISALFANNSPFYFYRCTESTKQSECVSLLR